MSDLIGLLQITAIAGAVYCAGAYVYGYVLKSKGTRHLHTAGLLFTGVALANVPVLLVAQARGDVMTAKINLVIFLLLSVLCQSLGAFRGRKGDRRRRADDTASAEPASETLRKAA